MSELCNEIEKLGKGIGNANRYRILEALMDGSKTVGEIVGAVALSQPYVSQNLKTLKNLGLVHDTRRGQEVEYAIDVAYMTSLLKRLVVDIERCKKKGNTSV